MKQYTRRQLRILAACFVAYTAAYISRTNLAPALDAIQTSFGLTAAQAGLLSTLFAIPYAAGQIVNGTLVDRFRPRTFILLGLLGSAAVNAAFSFAPSYPMLVGLWFLNGCFQSMIWTPIVRICAAEFQSEVRAKALFLLSVTLILGYLMAWLISGLLTSQFSWRAAFRASGVVTAALGVLSCFALKGAGLEEAAEGEVLPQKRMSVLKVVFGTDLALALLCCTFNGYVRDSIMNWAPKLLQDTQGIDLSSALGVILIIPIVNFFGIQAGKYVYRLLKNRVLSAVIVQMLLCTVFSLVLTLTFHLSPVFCIALLGLCSATAYSLNPLLTSILPMDYLDTGRVGMVSGLIDAMIYVGSAFSGTFTGFLVDRFDWRFAFASWAVFSCVGVLLVYLAMRRRRALGKPE